MAYTNSWFDKWGLIENLLNTRMEQGEMSDWEKRIWLDYLSNPGSQLIGEKTTPGGEAFKLVGKLLSSPTKQANLSPPEQERQKKASMFYPHVKEGLSPLGMSELITGEPFRGIKMGNRTLLAEPGHVATPEGMDLPISEWGWNDALLTSEGTRPSYGGGDFYDKLWEGLTYQARKKATPSVPGTMGDLSKFGGTPFSFPTSFEKINPELQDQALKFANVAYQAPEAFATQEPVMPETGQDKQDWGFFEKMTGGQYGGLMGEHGFMKEQIQPLLSRLKRYAYPALMAMSGMGMAGEQMGGLAGLEKGIEAGTESISLGGVGGMSFPGAMTSLFNAISQPAVSIPATAWSVFDTATAPKGENQDIDWDAFFKIMQAMGYF